MSRHAPARNGIIHSNGESVDSQLLPGNQPQNTPSSLGALISEAEGLKEILRDAHDRSHRLLAALKRQRKQSKLVATTLASLRQLQQIEG